MATLEQLQAQRTQLLNEIHRRGGIASAPKFAAQLKELEGQIRTMRSGTTTTPSNPATNTPATTTPGTTTPPVEERNPNNGAGTPADNAGGGVGDGSNPGGSVNPGNQATDVQRALDLILPLINSGFDFGDSIYNRYYDDNSFRHISEDVTQGEQDALGYLKDEYNRSLVRDPNAQMILDRRIAGLEGYNAQENQGLREGMTQELNRGYATAKDRLMSDQAKSGVRGAAGLAQQAGLSRQYGQQRDNVERDLMIENVQEKQRRLQSLQDYNTQLTTQESAQRKSAVNDLYTGEQNRGARQLLGQQFNIGQDQAKATARASTGLGGAGLLYGLTSNERADETQKDLSNRIMDFYTKNAAMQQNFYDQYFKSINKANA